MWEWYNPRCNVSGDNRTLHKEDSDVSIEHSPGISCQLELNIVQEKSTL